MPPRAVRSDTLRVTSAIRTEGLTTFYGSTPGIIDLDLDVRAGEVFGFLGPNGSGKTTTIRTVLDLIRPSRGSATVLGLDSHRDSDAVKARIGYLPGDVAMWPEMTGGQLLDHLASLRRRSLSPSIARYAERLDADLTRPVGTLSSGNRQKIAVIQAFMHEPELLVLDEPSSGLDPLMQQEFYRMVDEVRAAGRTVFLSSHILPEVERVADRVGIVRRGRLVAVETIPDLKAKARRRIDFHFGTTVDVAEFTGIDGVDDARPLDGGAAVSVTVAGSVDAVVKAAARHEVTNVVSHEGDLESAFLAYYSGDPDAS